MRFGLLILCIVISFNVHAQDSYEFSLLRQDDQVAPVNNPSFYNKLKYLKTGKNRFLSFGGSYRGQYEYFKNEEFNFSPNEENGWYLQRFLLHANWKVNKNIRWFGELGSSLVIGKEDVSPVDEDELYLNQFFVDFDFGSFNASIGRKNLKLGSRRLIDLREGPNVRRSFDQVTFEWKRTTSSILFFTGIPVRPLPGVFDNDVFGENEVIWGVYGNKIHSGKNFIDVYYVGNHYNSITYALGEGEETRHSLGVRIWRNNGPWNYDNELVVQSGTFEGKPIRAWTISFNFWKELNAQHVIGLKTELISGSSSNDRLATFNPLYPRGAYFGRVARFGPANLIDLHPYWQFKKGRFFMEVDYDIFWRYSTSDAVYGPPMNIVIASDSSQRLIAQQIGTIFNFSWEPMFSIELETNIILPEEFIKASRLGAETLIHGVLTLEIKF